MRNQLSVSVYSQFAPFVGLNLRNNGHFSVLTRNLTTLNAAKPNTNNRARKRASVKGSGRPVKAEPSEVQIPSRVKTFLIRRLLVKLLTRTCITPRDQRGARELRYEVKITSYILDLYSTSISITTFREGVQIGKTCGFPFQDGYNVDSLNEYYGNLLCRVQETKDGSVTAFSRPLNSRIDLPCLSTSQSLIPFRILSFKPVTTGFLLEGAILSLRLLQRPIDVIQEQLISAAGIIKSEEGVFNAYFVRTYYSMFTSLLNKTNRPSAGDLGNYRQYMSFLRLSIETLPLAEVTSEASQG